MPIFLDHGVGLEETTFFLQLLSHALRGVDLGEDMNSQSLDLLRI
jgi:hypothetical protein